MPESPTTTENTMALTTPPAAQRDANSARTANQAAEAAVCQAAVLNGYLLTDEQIAAAQTAISDAILQHLYKLDMQVQLVTLAAADPAPPRQPRTIPATTTRW